jgi:hypothetical protein
MASVNTKGVADMMSRCRCQFCGKSVMVHRTASDETYYHEIPECAQFIAQMRAAGGREVQSLIIILNRPPIEETNRNQN